MSINSPIFVAHFWEQSINLIKPLERGWTIIIERKEFVS